MKRTLLDMTQGIASALSTDEVNSISDNPEGLQIAECIKTSYYNILARNPISNLMQLVQLNPSLDLTQPVIMYVPQGIGRIEYLKYYNASTSEDSDNGNGVQHDINLDIQNNSGSATDSPLGYEYVTILPNQQFMDMVDAFNPNDTNVDSFVFSSNINGFPGSFTFQYQTDKQPRFCTILSNYYVIFDSYDNTVDSTLQSSKTKAFGEVIPIWMMQDTFIPNLPEELFQLLYNEAKSLAYFELKQMVHSKAERDAAREWSSMQKRKSITQRPTDFDALPDFGRRPASYGFNRWMKNDFNGQNRSVL